MTAKNINSKKKQQEINGFLGLIKDKMTEQCGNGWRSQLQNWKTILKIFLSEFDLYKKIAQ